MASKRRRWRNQMPYDPANPRYRTEEQPKKKLISGGTILFIVLLVGIFSAGYLMLAGVP